MTPVPRADRVIEGLINLRGAIVTAFDMRHRLGLEDRPDGEVPMNMVLRHDDGAGEVLYVAGDIRAAGDLPVSYLARWDGVDWSALGSGPFGIPEALAFYDDGSGSALYAGGAGFLERSVVLMDG